MIKNLIEFISFKFVNVFTILLIIFNLFFSSPNSKNWFETFISAQEFFTFTSCTTVPSGINFFKLLLCGPLINKLIISFSGSFIMVFASINLISDSNSPVSEFSK